MPIGEAVGAIGSSLINAISSARNASKQARYNRELADRQYGHQVDMWNKQNQYNAPIQQMQRFKDAGLNPHLIYGKGSAASGNSTSMPQYQEQAPDFSRRTLPNPADMLATYNALELSRENAIMANYRRRDLPLRLAHETEHIKQKGILTSTQADVAGEQNRRLYHQYNYDMEVAKNKAILSNKNVDAATLDNTWKELQAEVYRNSTRQGLTLDQSRLQQGWTDIMNGNYLTPQAKSIYIDAGSYGLQLLKNIVPAKILQGIRQKPGTSMQSGSTTYGPDGKVKSETIRETIRKPFKKNK